MKNNFLLSSLKIFYVIILLLALGTLVSTKAQTKNKILFHDAVEVLIEEGMRVKEGQVLARLDDTNLQASLKLAEAQLESAMSALGSAASSSKRVAQYGH